MTRDSVKTVGILLMDLSEELSTDDFKVTPEEILENLERRTISAYESQLVKKWLST